MEGVMTFDSSYPTGGEPLAASALGFSSITSVRIHPTGGYVFEYDYTNKKVLVYVEEAVAAGGPLLELADTTDIATIAPRFSALGY